MVENRGDGERDGDELGESRKVERDEGERVYF